MKAKFSFLSLGLLLGLGLNSCSSTEDVFIPEEQQVEIKLTSAILTPETRGANASEQSTQIISGQAVGVTIANASAAHDNVQWNVGANGALTSTSTSPIYYGTTAATITAYHPYNAAWSTLTTQQFSVQEDQSADGYKNSDLLWTTKTQERTTESVSLVFAHKLAKVNVNLSGTSFTESELASATISIANVELNTGIDLSTGALSAATTSNVGEIIAAKNSKTASAIVVPQTVTSGKVLIKVALGSAVYGYTLPSDATFAAGTSYTYNMTLSKTQLSMSSSSITDWTAGATTDVTGEELTGDSHEYVDLGLPSGTLWATYNVGANSIGDYGDYFSWGETNTKQIHLLDTYKYYEEGNNSGFSKYNDADKLTTLQNTDDVATVLWGSNWKTPTQSEWEELVTNTNHEFTTINGAFGCKLTSKSSGYTDKYLFFPASEYKSGSNTICYEYGSYWSSSIMTTNITQVYVFSFCQNTFGTQEPTASRTDTRVEGRTVRPVRKLN